MVGELWSTRVTTGGGQSSPKGRITSPPIDGYAAWCISPPGRRPTSRTSNGPGWPSGPNDRACQCRSSSVTRSTGCSPATTTSSPRWLPPQESPVGCHHARNGTGVAELLVDTDVCIDHPAGVRRLPRGAGRLGYSVITPARAAGRRQKRGGAQCQAPSGWHGRDPPRSPNSRPGQLLGRELSALRKPAAIIAATALVHSMALHTNNVRDFRRVRACGCAGTELGVSVAIQMAIICRQLPPSKGRSGGLAGDKSPGQALIGRLRRQLRPPLKSLGVQAPGGSNPSPSGGQSHFSDSATRPTPAQAATIRRAVRGAFTAYDAVSRGEIPCIRIGGASSSRWWRWNGS